MRTVYLYYTTTITLLKIMIDKNLERYNLDEILNKFTLIFRRA